MHSSAGHGLVVDKEGAEVEVVESDVFDNAWSGFQVGNVTFPLAGRGAETGGGRRDPLRQHRVAAWGRPVHDGGQQPPPPEVARASVDRGVDRRMPRISRVSVGSHLLLWEGE